MSVPAGNARRPFNNFEGEEEKRLVEKLLEIDEKDGIGLNIAKRIRGNEK